MPVENKGESANILGQEIATSPTKPIEVVNDGDAKAEKDTEKLVQGSPQSTAVPAVQAVVEPVKEEKPVVESAEKAQEPDQVKEAMADSAKVQDDE